MENWQFPAVFFTFALQLWTFLGIFVICNAAYERRVEKIFFNCNIPIPSPETGAKEGASVFSVQSKSLS